VELRHGGVRQLVDALPADRWRWSPTQPWNTVGRPTGLPAFLVSAASAPRHRADRHPLRAARPLPARPSVQELRAVLRIVDPVERAVTLPVRVAATRPGRTRPARTCPHHRSVNRLADQRGTVGPCRCSRGARRAAGVGGRVRDRNSCWRRGATTAARGQQRNAQRRGQGKAGGDS
jgi:hypothetical protein